MTTKPLKPGWKVWRFDQMAHNVNVRIDDPSKSGAEFYVGLDHLDSDSLKIRRWGSPDEVEATKLCFKKGDIIFGRRRAYQRKLGVAEFDGICSAHAMVLRAKPEVVLPEFLPFFMQSDLFMKRAVEISVGSLSPTINWKTMAIQEFALPPLEEQIRIIEAMSATIELREELKIALDSMRIVIKSSIDDFWSSASLEDATLLDLSVHLTSGSRGWAEYYDPSSESKFLRITNMTRSSLELDLNDMQFVNPPDTLEAQRTRVQPNDVLISVTAELGLIAVVPNEIGDAYVNQHIALIRPNQSLVNGRYIGWYLCSRIGQRAISRYNDAGAKAGMSLKSVAALKIPICDMVDQLRIVGLLDSQQSACEALSAKIEMSHALQKKILGEIFDDVH